MMSYPDSNELHFNSLLTDQVSSGAETRGPAEGGAGRAVHTAGAVAMLTVRVTDSSSPEPLNSCESEEEFLLREKEVLLKAVEELRLRRQVVAAARLRIEQEIQQRSTEEARRPEAPEDSSFENESRRRQYEAKAPDEFLQSTSEDQVLESSPKCRTPSGSSLEQRLRAEINGLAAAQRKYIDASRAKFNAKRNAAPFPTA